MMSSSEAQNAPAAELNSLEARNALLASLAAKAALDTAQVRKLIAEGTLTRAFVESITSTEALNALFNRGLQALIYKGKLMPAQLKAISNKDVANVLCDPGVQQFIHEGKLTGDQLTVIANYSVVSDLLDQDVQKRITKGELTVDEMIVNARRDLDEEQNLVAKIEKYIKILAKQGPQAAQDKSASLSCIVEAYKEKIAKNYLFSDNFSKFRAIIHQEMPTLSQHRHSCVFNGFFCLFKASTWEARVTSHRLAVNLEHYFESLTKDEASHAQSTLNANPR